MFNNLKAVRLVPYILSKGYGVFREGNSLVRLDVTMYNSIAMEILNSEQCLCYVGPKALKKNQPVIKKTHIDNHQHPQN